MTNRWKKRERPRAALRGPEAKQTAVKTVVRRGQKFTVCVGGASGLITPPCPQFPWVLLHKWKLSVPVEVKLVKAPPRAALGEGTRSVCARVCVSMRKTTVP